FIGLTVDLDNLTALQATQLNGLLPRQLGLAPAAPFSFTASGYGFSGTPDAAEPGFAYVYHAGNANEQYGTHRHWSNTVVNHLNHNDGTYNYDAMNWFLRDAAGGAIANEGQGNSGDSGSAIIRDAKIVGVFTTTWGDNMRNLFTNMAGDEGFKLG